MQKGWWTSAGTLASRAPCNLRSERCIFMTFIIINWKQEYLVKYSVGGHWALIEQCFDVMLYKLHQFPHKRKSSTQQMPLPPGSLPGKHRPRQVLLSSATWAAIGSALHCSFRPVPASPLLWLQKPQFAPFCEFLLFFATVPLWLISAPKKPALVPGVVWISRGAGQWGVHQGS